MCVVSTPKVQQSSTTTKTPEPTVIRNNYLDGLDPASKALRKGRSSLRIERAGSGTTPVVPPATDLAPPGSAPALPVSAAVPSYSPVRGGGAVAGARITRNRAMQ